MVSRLRWGLVGGRCWCRTVRDFYKTPAAELVARFDRVAACSADKAAYCRYSRCRGSILRWRGWRRLVDRWRRGLVGGRCWCRTVRDFYKTPAAELVARFDRVGACSADKAARCRWNGDRGGSILRWRGERGLLVHRRRCLIHGCRGLVRHRCRRGYLVYRCRGDIPGPCTAAPAELLVRRKRRTAGSTGEPAGRRGRGRSCSGRFFNE